MDEGLPIAYELLEKGVPVLASDGEQVGTVDTSERAREGHLPRPLINTPGHGYSLLEAPTSIASIHEHGVDLRIDTAAAQSLPAPEQAARRCTTRIPRRRASGATGCTRHRAQRLASRALSAPARSGVAKRTNRQARSPPPLPQSSDEHRQADRHGRKRVRRAPARAGGAARCPRWRRAPTPHDAPARRTTARCAPRFSATATGSCTARRSAG